MPCVGRVVESAPRRRSRRRRVRAARRGPGRPTGARPTETTNVDESKETPKPHWSTRPSYPGTRGQHPARRRLPARRPRARTCCSVASEQTSRPCTSGRSDAVGTTGDGDGEDEDDVDGDPGDDDVHPATRPTTRAAAAAALTARRARRRHSGTGAPGARADAHRNVWSGPICQGVRAVIDLTSPGVSRTGAPRIECRGCPVRRSHARRSSEESEWPALRQERSTGAEKACGRGCCTASPAS